MAKSRPPSGRGAQPTAPSPGPAAPSSSTVASDPTRRERYRDAFVVVTLEADGALLRITRSSLAHPDIAALLGSYRAVIAVLDDIGRRGRTLLFDTRAPVGRNDPAFEQAMAVLRPRIDQGFVRIGVLVASAIGALQLKRWVSADGIERIVTHDEAVLLPILLADLPSRRT